MAKIWLFVAVVIVTAHNYFPHDHESAIFTFHHDPDNDADDDHDVFSYDFLAHTFIQQTFTYNIVKHVVAEEPSFIITCIEKVHEYLWVTESSYAVKYEFPPPKRCISSSGFCGPPYMV